MNPSRFHHRIRLSALTALVCIAAGLPVDSRAQVAADGTVDLLTTPPELTTSVSPNVVLTFDDSGSMGRNYMPDSRPYGGGGWGATDQQNTSGSQGYNSGGRPFLCAGIIDPRITDPLDPRSWAMNGVYYNPNAKYDPPLMADGVTAFPNATYSAAWDNGIIVNRPDSPASSSTRNLGSGTRFCGNAAGYYRYKNDAPALTLDANGNISNTTALFNTNNWEWVALPSAERQNFANWYSYYHTRYMASVSAVSRAYAKFDRNLRTAWQNINNRRLAATTAIYAFEDDAAVNDTRSEFYTWLFSTPVGGNTPNQAAADRVGQFFQRAGGAVDTNPYWDRGLDRELSCRKNFHIQMTDGLWNNAVVDTASDDRAPLPRTLPDDRGYAEEDQSEIYWNEAGPNNRSMADIAFHYWATDLRPDFMGDPQTALKVRPYLADRSTNIWGPALGAGDDPLDNKEIYWNPANDPATWPHLVQFMIGFGVSGTIPKSPENLLRLRQGDIQWPATDLGTDDARKIDDMWHAAINSRGQFFAASNPGELISALQEIIASVIAQSSASTPVSLSLPILTGGNSGYAAGYDSTDWSGSLRRNTLDASNGSSTGVLWDAGCILTGGTCMNPPGTSTARDPDTRVIVTSDGAGTGNAFRWGSLTAEQQTALNPDTFGQQRVDYLRGVRTNESTASPRFRQRGSVLGAVINGQPTYVSSPRSGFTDIYPDDAPESELPNSYAKFQNDQRARAPMVYVGANDGMLHAFDAESGVERWAYVPNVLFDNGRLLAATASNATLVPGVDAGPREADVYIDGAWRTILVGSMRLGGRGIYALDISVPLAGGTETSAATALPMWEFTSGDVASTAGDAPCVAGSTTCASLGYTYESANVARLNYVAPASENSWVALVSSGYFPEDDEVAANPDDITEAAASRTSLMVIDVQSGRLIREIRTSDAPQTRPAGFKTYGLSTAVVYDIASDDIDDLAYAGDLAGNLWRFDLSSPDPADWTVDLMFTTYGDGGAENVGDQPIVFNPTALRDFPSRRPILIVGTGKYLGKGDRTSQIPEQAFYGVRDYGTHPADDMYPIRVNQMVTQVLSEDNTGERQITGWVAPTGTVPAGIPPMLMRGTDPDVPIEEVLAQGWRMELNIPRELGERAQRRPIPLYSSNSAVLYTLIPKNDDPCDPGARYGVMLVNAGTGGALGAENNIVGQVPDDPIPEPPADPTIPRGGGALIIPGLTPLLSPEVKEVLNATIPVWHRGAWRELLDVQ